LKLKLKVKSLLSEHKAAPVVWALEEAKECSKYSGGFAF